MSGIKTSMTEARVEFSENSQDNMHRTPALPIGAERVDLTEQENCRLRRKTDKVILSLLVWGYFLQIIDKTALGYGALFGLRTDLKLVGKHYSLASSATPIAQLAWQPISSYLIVRAPHRILLPLLVLFWGITMVCMAASWDFGSLFAGRFMLGLFEGSCLPLFAILTGRWYRRSEQPLRVACWYGTNGVATIAISVIAYGLAKISHSAIATWRILFLTIGLLTVLSAPLLWWFLPNDIDSARFLTEHEKRQTYERLRANQSGAAKTKYKMAHLVEVILDLKTYPGIGIALCLNCGASVTNTFGPLILSGLGFDKYTTSLLNKPFGATQILTIAISSFAAQRGKKKGGVLLALALPIIAGLAALYMLPRDPSHTAPLLVSYYLLGFIFGGNPILVAWMVGNTGGFTKGSVIMAIYNAAAGAGNIIGPLLFATQDAPAYKPGLKSVLAMFATLAALVILQMVYLVFLNKLQERKRVKDGKPAKLADLSMERRYIAMAEVADAEQGPRIGDNAFNDLTDRQNDEFIYIY
ncbi:hypothetical protein AAFC00_003360 [Neodothiora populina]|uniref:Major facilitator superfamily (MFS) profile domain-containing protein n=1 Tax=Neodothiora populina TaxID=2781224 RepID=A0ABR3PBF9_9PEZI